VQEEPICDDCLMASWENCVVGPKPDNVVQVPAKAKSGRSNFDPAEHENLQLLQLWLG